MDTRVSRQLNQDAQNQMAMELLKRFWFAQVQALVDATGSKATIEAMTPYFRNSAIAGTMVSMKLIGLDKVGFPEMAEMWGLQNTCLGWDNMIIVHKDGVSFEHASPCAFLKAPKEACVIFCEVAGRTSCESLNPEWTHDFEVPSYNGGPNCKGGHGYLHGKGTGPPEGQEILRIPRHVFEERYPLALRQSLGTQYYGEFIVLTANAALDALGEKAFSEVMCPAMFAHGRAIANTVLTEKDLDDGEGLALRAVDSVNNLLKQAGQFIRRSDSVWKKEITECPFSHASKEFCEIFQSYLNGICTAFDTNASFRYSARMTCGASSCLGELITSTQENPPNNNGIYEGHLVSLKLRLAKGEITEQDYYRLKKLILEDR